MSAKTKSGKSSYDIALSIKELMDKNVKNKVILEATGLKQTQLTYYKCVIRNGYIEDLKNEYGVKELCKRAPKEPIAKKDEASVGPEADEKLQTINPMLNSSMIKSIENEPNDASDIFVEYKDIPDYISYEPPKVKLDEPEIGRKSRVPNEGKKTFIEDGKEIKYTPLSEHIKISPFFEDLLARHMFFKMKMQIEMKEREAEFDYNKTLLDRKVKDLEEENFGLKDDNEILKNQIHTLHDDKEKLLEQIRELEEMVKKL